MERTVWLFPEYLSEWRIGTETGRGEGGEDFGGPYLLDQQLTSFSIKLMSI